MNVYGQLIAAQLENLSSAPAGVPAGRAYFDTTLHMPRYYDDNGTTWRTLADLTSTQSLSGKTLSSPTLVTPVLGTPSSGLLSSCTGLPLTSGVTGILPVANGGTGVANNAASTITISGSFALTLTLTNTTSVTLPTSGTLSTLAGAEVITNKDHDGGTASNTSRLTVPKAALSTLTGLTRKQGTLVYDTTANALLADDGSNLNQIGGGSGEKNYITSPSTASGWTASGAGITVATTTSGLPRPNTTKTGILLTGVSGSTAYAYFRFILDDADASKKLKFQFDMEPGTAVASDFKIDVYSNTANDYTTGNTRLALSTDVSAVTALPALTGTFRAAFDAPAISAKYIEIRIGMNTTQTHTLVVSDVIVGPGVTMQGTAASEWIAYTPTWGGAASPAINNGTTAGKWRRVGDSMEVSIQMDLGSSSTLGSGAYSWSIPTGYTIDTSKIPTGANFGTGGSLGVGLYYDSGSSANARTGNVYYVSSTTVSIYFNATGTAGSGLTGLSVTDAFLLKFTIPIAEWAGSGTVNVVQNDVEYVYNSSTADSADTTSFAYGPAGVAIGSYTTAARKKRVRFLTPIGATDQLVIEVQKAGVGPWVAVADGAFSQGIGSLQYQNNKTFGIGFDYTSINSTDIDVVFGIYANVGATYDSAGAAWSGFTTNLWRVKKFKGGNAVGFSEASTTALGLVKPSHTALAGSATAYSAGGSLVRSGTYTPTLANIANVASSVVAANSMIWSQVGQVVTCSGYLTTTETAGGPTDTQFTLTLPVAPTSNFAQLYEAGGTCTSKASTTVDNPGQVYATTSAKTVTLQFASTVTTATRDLTYHFQYLAN